MPGGESLVGRGITVKGYHPLLSFGRESAATYDQHPRGDESETVALLRDLAKGRRTLELAIGTGRIALPLAEAGVPVEGIDLSPEMVEMLRRKPGGQSIPVTIGDFAHVPVEGEFGLIYLVYNTIYNLLTQEEQVTCFANVAKHLSADGVFLVEAFTPGYLFRIRDHQYVDAELIEVDEVRLDVARHDPVKQWLEESHLVMRAEGVSLFPIVCRYIWPAEMDLMAQMAGLRCVDRWGGWLQEPFTADSKRHVSVYSR